MLLFVGGLPLTIRKQRLQQEFSQYGSVTALKFPYNRLTRTRRGFAFVEMPSRGEALKAIRNLNGRTISDKIIVVTPAPFQRRPQPVPIPVRNSN